MSERFASGPSVRGGGLASTVLSAYVLATKEHDEEELRDGCK
jgi:hypothetical protein